MTIESALKGNPATSSNIKALIVAESTICYFTNDGLTVNGAPLFFGYIQSGARQSQVQIPRVTDSKLGDMSHMMLAVFAVFDGNGLTSVYSCDINTVTEYIASRKNGRDRWSCSISKRWILANCDKMNICSGGSAQNKDI